MTNKVTCPMCKIEHIHDFAPHLRSNSLTIDFCKRCKELEAKNRIETATQKEIKYFISIKAFNLFKKSIL